MLPSPDAPHIPVAFPTRASGCGFHRAPHRAPRPQGGWHLAPLRPLSRAAPAASPVCLWVLPSTQSPGFRSSETSSPSFTLRTSLQACLPLRPTHCSGRKRNPHLSSLAVSPTSTTLCGTRWLRAGIIPLLPQLVPVPQPLCFQNHAPNRCCPRLTSSFFQGPVPVLCSQQCPLSVHSPGAWRGMPHKIFYPCLQHPCPPTGKHFHVIQEPPKSRLAPASSKTPDGESLPGTH